MVRRSNHAWEVAWAATAVVIFTADLWAPPEFAVWFFYVVPVVLSSRASYRKAPYYSAGMCTALIGLSLFIDGVAGLSVAVNGVFASSLLWLAAVMVVQLKKSEDALRPGETYIKTAMDHLPVGTVVKSVDPAETRNSEARFRVVFEYAPNAIYLHDMDGMFVDANKAAEAFTGYTREELIGQNFLTVNLLSKEQLARLEENLARNARGEPTGPDEFTLQRKDGGRVSLEIQTLPVEVDGKVLVLGVARDVTRRKKAEQLLLDSEQRHRLLFQSHPLPMWFYDTETLAFLDVNESAVRHYGYSREEFLSMTIKDIRPDEDIPALLADVSRRSGKVDDRGRSRHRKKDGSIIDVEITSHEIEYPGKRAVVILANDVTGRRRAEEAVREAEENYRNIFEGVPIGLYLSSKEGIYQTVNQELLRMLRYGTEEELISATAHRSNGFYVKSGRRAEFIQKILDEGDVSGFESQVFRKDGGIIWISETARAVYDNNGLLTGFEGFTMEITSRRQATESMVKLLHAVEQTSDIIFMTDVTGRVTYVNPAFEETYGYKKSEIYGRTPTLLKSGVQDAEFYSRLWDTILTGQTIRAEFINRTKDGELVTVEATISPVLDSDTGLSGFIAVQRDVTMNRKSDAERKSLQEQLFQVQKLESIGTLASGIAHDFNNVLGIILGYTTILQHEAGENDRALKGVEAISKAVQRGADLVRQILVFARKTDASFLPFDVNQLLAELKKMMEETFPRTIITTLTLDSHLPPIRADKNQMHQTLLNLFVNARDAMPDGGIISILTRRVTIDEVRNEVPRADGSEFIHIGINDTGTGMDEATKQRMFEPFFTTKGVGKGTGLGLAVVYGIIRSHGGYISVQSTPGEGTTFNLFFPVFVDRPQHAGRPVETPLALVGGTETILLIEDERMLMELLKSSLEAKGYSVLVATDGAAAVKLYSQFHTEIALVITDLGLPKLDGAKVFVEIKKVNPHVRVLIASGYIDPGVKSGILKEGARGFIQKPYVLTDILKKVRETLDAP